MNNNTRGNNNRRRGRSNRPGGNGGNGGQQLNRIDSRARGNAPQLLEKYRKLAQDAHLNGDRVQAEYYLQFADHYFRVLADQRVRQDEQQRGRRDERWQEGGESERDDSDDGSDFSADSGFPNFDQPPVYSRREREERDENQERDERPVREDRAPREERRPRPVNGNVEEPSQSAADDEGSDDQPQNAYEPPANPFVRGNREVRETRPTRGLRPRRDDRRPRPDDAGDEAPVGLNPDLLPPAISVARAPEDAEASEPEAKPRRGRPRKPRPSDDAQGEALESVG